MPKHRKPSKPSKNVEIAHRSLQISMPTLDTFFNWMAERHRIHEKRSAGEQPPWSKDQTLNSHKFCNVFRIFDRGSQFLLHNIINKGSQEHREICFRVILFKLFNRASTWDALQKDLGSLTWATFNLDAYEQAFTRLAEKGPLYTSAYQIPKPDLIKGPSFKNHLLVLQMMMDDDLPAKLLACTRMQEAYELFKLYPGMGPFLSYQMVLDINMTPEINYPENEWAVCGPGSQECLERIFGPEVRGIETDAIEYLYKSQSEHFTRLGITDPPKMSASRPGVGFVDIEHSLCECHKYLGRQRQNGTWRASDELITNDLPTKWTNGSGEAVPSSAVHNSSDSNLDHGEDTYEVSHIISQREVDSSGELKYRIRWTGYGPDEDRWMSEAELENAPEVLKEWRVRRSMETQVNGRVAKIRSSNHPEKKVLRKPNRALRPRKAKHN